MLPLLAAILTTSSPIDVTLDLSKPGIRTSRSLYGIFFEEINHAGDGGIYGELIRNRGMEEGNGSDLPPGWRHAGTGTAKMIGGSPLNSARRQSLMIDGGTSINDGFWGIPARRGESYRAVVWARGTAPTADLALQSADGKGLGSAPLKGITNEWQRFEMMLRAGGNDAKAQLAITPKGGNLELAFVSLFPSKTWKGRANGMRPDLAKKVDDLNPAFVRFPGGCYVEGNDLAQAFDWKKSLGPLEGRPGSPQRLWGYPSTDGLGLHEYLQWCEDLGAEPLYVANCGMSHTEIAPLDKMDKYVQDALDAIEYANGPVTSKWGALRAQHGHPKPFNLKYVEIGNENGASWSFGGPKPYAERYPLLYHAIKKAWPNIVTIADNPVPHPMEVIDEHYYANPAFFWSNMNRYDRYPRTGPKIYVGEYAVTQDCGQGNLQAALGEAAFMVGMERNSDIVTMSSYAPLFVNVNTRQWNPDALVFDASRSFGTPSFHVQQLFSRNRVDRVLPTTFHAPTAAYRTVGGVGLQTWRTAAEFKDLEVTVDGKPVATNGPWRFAEGKWTAKDGLISQSVTNEGVRAYLRGPSLADSKKWTMHVKGRKISGEEGFILMFQVNDSENLQWNVGGWGNVKHAFQKGGSIISNEVPGRIETDRWYDMRLEGEGPKVSAYLDGKLVQTMVDRPSPDFAVLGGLKGRDGDILIKVVNGADADRPVNFNLEGAPSLEPTGEATILTGSSLTEENSFDAPERIAPRTRRVSGVSDRFTYTVPARSVTILRLRTRRW